MANKDEFVGDTCRTIPISVRRTSKETRKKTGRNHTIRFHLVQQETDGHQGFSFPGGGLEDGDKDHLDRARKSTRQEGIDLPDDLDPIGPPEIFTPEDKRKVGYGSDHDTYYYVFVKESFEVNPPEHEEGDVNSVAIFDMRSLPLSESYPPNYPILALKHQIALHKILMDFDMKRALNRRKVSDTNIRNLLDELSKALYLAQKVRNKLSFENK